MEIKISLASVWEEDCFACTLIHAHRNLSYIGGHGSKWKNLRIFSSRFYFLKISIKICANKIQLYFFFSATLYPMSDHPSSIFTSHRILSLTLPVANKARAVSSWWNWPAAMCLGNLNPAPMLLPEVSCQLVPDCWRHLIDRQLQAQRPDAKEGSRLPPILITSCSQHCKLEWPLWSHNSRSKHREAVSSCQQVCDAFFFPGFFYCPDWPPWCCKLPPRWFPCS